MTTTMNTITQPAPATVQYAVKCTRRATGEVYYAYSGNLRSQRQVQTWADRGMAELIVKDSTKMWGDQITYEVEEIQPGQPLPIA